MDLFFKLSFILLYCGALVCARDTIFIADLLNNNIWAAPLDTLEFEALPLQGVLNPIAVDFDPDEYKVYWTDARGTINRANLDGTDQEVVVAYLSIPDGIAIDAVNRHMYWTDTGTNRTERAHLDGTNRQIIIQDGHDQPRAIVVDPEGGRLFWTDWGANPKIERSNLDGSNRVTLIDTELHLPNGLAVDFEGERIYWCDAGLNKIEAATLDGDDRRELFRIENEDIHPFDIGVYNDDIYWSDWRYKAIIRMNKYIVNRATAVGTPVFERAGGLHIYKDPVNECASTPCYNGGDCIDEIQYYQCNCTATGYDGDLCQTDINECTSLPGICDANAVCTNTLSSYTCQCTTGYEGNGITCTVSPPASGCHYPGDIENGYVVPPSGHEGNIFEPGEKVSFTCQDGFSREGSNQAFCQIGGAWSDENPNCEEEEPSVVSPLVLIGGGVGGGILIIILFIILIVVCCRKRQSRNADDLPALQVTYQAQVVSVPKEPNEGVYNATIDSQYIPNPYPPQASTDTLSYRQPAPNPRPTSNHVYDEVKNIPGAGAAGATARPVKLPSYIDVIGEGNKEADDNGYAIMKDSVMIPGRFPPGNTYRSNNLHQ